MVVTLQTQEEDVQSVGNIATASLLLVTVVWLKNYALSIGYTALIGR